MSRARQDGGHYHSFRFRNMDHSVPVSEPCIWQVTILHHHCSSRGGGIGCDPMPVPVFPQGFDMAPRRTTAAEDSCRPTAWGATVLS